MIKTAGNGKIAILGRFRATFDPRMTIFRQFLAYATAKRIEGKATAESLGVTAPSYRRRDRRLLVYLHANFLKSVPIREIRRFFDSDTDADTDSD